MDSDSHKRKRDDEEGHDSVAKRSKSAPMVREPSIFNMKAIDDVVRYVGDFIYQHCDKANVEVRLLKTRSHTGQG